MANVGTVQPSGKKDCHKSVRISTAKGNESQGRRKPKGKLKTKN